MVPNTYRNKNNLQLHYQVKYLCSDSFCLSKNNNHIMMVTIGSIKLHYYQQFINGFLSRNFKTLKTTQHFNL